MAYLDTSILGSYYCAETLSSVVNAALGTLQGAHISPLVELEFASSLSLKVRNQALDRASAQASWQKFQQHRTQHLFTIADIGPREHELARRWLSQFNTPLRTLDAIHLGVSKSIREPLWTTDKLLARSAAALNVSCRLIS